MATALPLSPFPPSPIHLLICLNQNSWGTGFGINGYFLMALGTNECGIATCASYPVMR